jgi:hypothetical protein
MSATSSLDKTLRAAIAKRRLVKFVSDGCLRKGEPHDYGIYKGTPRLFYYQVGGQSRSGKLPGWRWAGVSDISGLEIMDESFAGPRPVSGRHVEWDELFASISRRG